MRMGDPKEMDSFMMQCSCKLGGSTIVSFWFSHWLEMLPLYRRFPQLFEASESKFSAVWEVGCYEEDLWQWNLGIQESLLVGDLHNQYLKLLLLLSNVEPRVGIEDGIVWHADQNNTFSVKSKYENTQNNKTI